ncbi:FixH family protein [Reyranella sp.]|uniref:FixH family protein n=1 Tax=Reyranella sp. TaxID=1929291 RepID=UPI003BACC5E5
MSTTTVGRGRYIPWLFVAGFAIVFAVNGTMIGVAVGSFSGLYTPKPRDRGLHYNEVIAAQQARDALGWRVEPIWRPGSDDLEIAVFDRAGRPLAGAQVAVALVRPAEKGAVVGVAMEAVDIGRHAGHVALPARGNWDVDISVEQGGQRFAQTRRMFLR